MLARHFPSFYQPKEKIKLSRFAMFVMQKFRKKLSDYFAAWLHSYGAQRMTSRNVPRTLFVAVLFCCHQMAVLLPFVRPHAALPFQTRSRLGVRLPAPRPSLLPRSLPHLTPLGTPRPWTGSRPPLLRSAMIARPVSMGLATPRSVICSTVHPRDE